MRYIILSDIHGNLQALQAVLSDCGAGTIINLGDIIGYGADPGACIDLIRSRASLSLMGNHEQVQLNWSQIKNFNPLARQSAEFTKNQLSREHMDWIRDLPLEAQFPGGYVSHGSPYHPKGFYYLMPGDTRSPYLALSLTKMERDHQRIAFFGHTHVPGCFTALGSTITYAALNSDALIHLDPAARYLINGGSVGQPRNQMSDAQYLIYDDETATIEKRSVPYDVQRAARKIREAGLPDLLWQRLLQGN